MPLLQRAAIHCGATSLFAHFRRAVFVLTLVLSASTILAADRPNFLWLVSEDNSFEWIHCYGNEQAKTPRIDALAQQGILFEHAYSNGPVCAVARSTLLRGIYATTAGSQNMRSRHAVPDRYRTYPDYLREAGYYCANNPKTDYNAKGEDKRFWDDSSKNAHYKNRPDGAPFFSVFNISTTHESSIFYDKPMDPQRLDPKTLILPPYLPDLPELRLDYARYSDRITEMDAQIGRYLDDLEKAGLAEDTIIIYMGDNGGILPRGKRYLYDTGVRIPLIVSIPPKYQHLSPFPTGSRVSEAVSFVDFLPTFLSLVGLDIPDYLQGRAFLGKKRQEPTTDHLTFLFADRFDEFYGMRRAVTDGRWKYIRRFRPDRPAAPYSNYQFGQPGWNAWRDAWKSGTLQPPFRQIWESPQPSEQIYDLSSDPWEINNLADDANYRSQLDSLRDRLRDTMQQTVDLGVIPEGLYPELAADSTIADYAQSGGFDYAGALELAFLASDSNPENIARFREALRAPDPIQRYWGLIGLAILKEKATDSVSEVETLLEDSFSVIRSTAAYTLWQLGKQEEASDTILLELGKEISSWSVFYALNIVYDLDLASRLPENWRENLGTDDDETGKAYVKRIQNILEKLR